MIRRRRGGQTMSAKFDGGREKGILHRLNREMLRYESEERLQAEDVVRRIVLERKSLLSTATEKKTYDVRDN